MDIILERAQQGLEKVKIACCLTGNFVHFISKKLHQSSDIYRPGLKVCCFSAVVNFYLLPPMVTS